MLYTKLDGQKISKIALGCADFGTKVNKEDAFALLDDYYERGGNLLDTARIYASWVEGGANASESTIGEWIKTRNLRKKIFIATKGGHPPFENMYSSRLDEISLRKDIEESLHYLQTDFVDIYYLHRDDKDRPVSEIMTVLNAFVEEGKARYIGVSNWKAERILEANRYAEERGLAKIRFSQIMWSYATVNKGGEPDDTLVIMDDEEYAKYQDSGVLLMPFSSQAQGFYTKAQKTGIENLSPAMQKKYDNPKNRERLQKLTKISDETGISATAVSLNYLLRNPLETLPVVGVSSKKYMDDTLQALDLEEKYFPLLKN